MIALVVLVVVVSSVLKSVAEPLVLRQGGRGREGLAAIGTLDLLAAVSVHPLVSAEVRELRVGLETDLALEGLDGAVNVLVLFQAARCRECLAALTARMRTGADVRRPDVTLQVARIREDFVAVLADDRLSG